MKIIVDTNIVFSALVNSSGKIGNLLMNSDDVFQFYTSDYLKEELLEHHEKIKKLSRLSDADIETLKSLIFNHIVFINTEIIATKIWIEAEAMMVDVDPDDTEFYALSQFLNCKIWTGDKKFHLKLLKKGVHQTLSTEDIFNLRLTLRP
jgi:predicted nucleic acid-binding protein